MKLNFGIVESSISRGEFTVLPNTI